MDSDNPQNVSYCLSSFLFDHLKIKNSHRQSQITRANSFITKIFVVLIRLRNCANIFANFNKFLTSFVIINVQLERPVFVIIPQRVRSGPG